MSTAAATYLLRSRGGAATRSLRRDAGRSCTLPLRWAGTRLAIILLYTTGIRRGELFRLKPQDYDAGNHTLLIQASKFHKSRLLPLPGDVAREVDKHLHARRVAYPSALVTEPLLWTPYSSD